jgi:hypothetical protein
MNTDLSKIDTQEKLLTLINGMETEQLKTLLAQYDQYISNSNEAYAKQEYYAEKGHNDWESVGEAYALAMIYSRLRMYLALFIEQLTAEQVSARRHEMSLQDLKNTKRQLAEIWKSESAKLRAIRNKKVAHIAATSSEKIQTDQIHQNFEIMLQTKQLLT